MQAAPNEWWSELFASAEWFDIHTDYNDERVRHEADLMERLMEIAPGSRLLDVPCGQGRHALEFAARGHRVTAVDITPALLKEGHRRAAERGLEVEWIERDMRSLGLPAEHDAGYCYFGSFGYFDDAGNEQFLRAVASALVPGGAFLIETQCAESLFRVFQARGWMRFGDLTTLEDRRYDVGTGRVESEWTIIRNGAIASVHSMSIRVYTVHELGEMLMRAGFARWRAFDAATGLPFKLGSGRLAIVAWTM